MTINRLKFYADTETQKNKYFCFKINDIFDLEARLKYWMKKFYIRSAWYECIEDGKVVSNERINLVKYVDYQEVEFIRKQ